MRNRMRLLAAMCLVSLASASMITAQSVSSRHGVGPYFGIGSDPDQVVMGGQGVFGVAGSPLHLSPGFDFGFGDNLNTVTLNFDITYDFVPTDARMAFYIGAGPTLAFYSSDRFRDDTEAGLSLVGGIKIPSGRADAVNLGVRAGLGDIPDLKMTATYLFSMH